VLLAIVAGLPIFILVMLVPRWCLGGLMEVFKSSASTLTHHELHAVEDAPPDHVRAMDAASLGSRRRKRVPVKIIGRVDALRAVLAIMEVVEAVLRTIAPLPYIPNAGKMDKAPFGSAPDYVAAVRHMNPDPSGGCDVYSQIES
jgi:hypothetical protein